MLVATILILLLALVVRLLRELFHNLVGLARLVLLGIFTL